MQENLPEIPTVEEITKNPRSATVKFQWGLLLFLIAYIVYTKQESVPSDERAGYVKQIAEANAMVFQAQKDRINDLKEREAKDQHIKVLTDSLKTISSKLGSGLIPPAKNILKDKDEK